MTGPRRIAITGASRGLGAALARQLAAPGVTLHLCARDLSDVAPLTADLEAQGAEVVWSALDLAVPGAGSDWIDAAWQENGLDLVILNAGLFDGRDARGMLETPARARHLVDTNLSGCVAPALVAFDRMRGRVGAQIVFISSLAALAPQPDTPSYSASKAGVTAFARALQLDGQDSAAQVTIVHAGHVETGQTDQHVGPLPGLISAPEAAAKILRAVRAGRREIAFPARLYWGIVLMNLLPHRIKMQIAQALRFHVRPPAPGPGLPRKNMQAGRGAGSDR